MIDTLRVTLAFLAGLLFVFALSCARTGPVLAPGFLFPPVCMDRPAEGVRVCVAWDPYLHDYVEVKRIPLSGIPPLRRS